jgi:hypothetical protein
MGRRGVNYTGKVRHCVDLPLLEILRVVYADPDKVVSIREERIRGALKYAWTDGPSMAKTSV